MKMNQNLNTTPAWGSFKLPADPSIKSTKLLFIFPGASEDNFFNIPPIGWTGTWHYVGFSILNACLKQHNFQTQLVDFRNLKNWSHFESIILESDAKAAILTSVTSVFPRIKNTASIIKNIRPDIKTVVGGAHVSIIPEDALACDQFDHIISGEGEKAILDIAYSLENGTDIERHITGVCPNLADLPFPDRDFFQVDEDPGFHFIERPHATLLTSRGCPFKCSFCQPAANQVFGNKVRQRPVENVIEEMELLRDKGFKSIRILDDLFLINPAWIKNFIRQYRQKGFTFQLICQARTDIIVKQKEMMAHLKEIGMDLVHIGLESGSDNVLKILNKRNKAENNIKALQICRDLDIEPFVNYIFGSPGETEEDMQKTIDVLNQYRVKYRGGNVLFPTVGTAIHQEFVKKNQIEPGITYFTSSIANIHQMNQDQEKNGGQFLGDLKKGYFKNVDYNLVKKYLDKSYHIDIEPNQQLEEELHSLVGNNGRVLIIFTEDSFTMKDIVGQIKTSCQFPMVIDAICPDSNAGDKKLSRHFNRIYSYSTIFKQAEQIKQDFRELNLPKYQLVLTPVQGEQFYCGWSPSYASLAFLLKQVNSSHFGFIDNKLYLSPISSTVINTIAKYEGLGYNLSWQDVFYVNQQGRAEKKGTLPLDNIEDIKDMRVMFFGASGKLRQFLNQFSSLFTPEQIAGVLDNDTNKHHSKIFNFDILPIESLETARPDLIIITSLYFSEILQQITRFSSSSKDLNNFWVAIA